MACNATLNGVNRKSLCDTNVMGSIKTIYLRPFSTELKTTLAEYTKYSLNTDKGMANEEISGDRNAGVFITQAIEFDVMIDENVVDRTAEIVEFNNLIKIPYLDAVVEYLDGTHQHFGYYNGVTVTGGNRNTGKTRQEGRTSMINLSGEEPKFSPIVTLI